MTNINSPFMRDLMEEINDNTYTIVNGIKMYPSIWNMMLSKRDIYLYTKGLRIHRNWKVTYVKKYYGIKGTKKTLYGNFMKLYNVIQENICS